MEFVLLGLAILALPIVSIILATSASGRVGALEAQVRSLSNALASLTDRLELARLNGAASSLPPAQPAQPEETGAASTKRISEAAVPPEPETGAMPRPETPVSPQPPVFPEPTRPAAAMPAPMPVKPKRDLESMIGGRWSVILGGIATALGAVLLVRATIEAGLLGPAARIVAAAIFSGALLAGGEWLRRQDRKLALPAFPNADIPAILTAAGAIGAFSTVFAAYALYDFLGAGPAFVALTLVGLATLALSAVHGPGLAALGVVGSYATPLLVSSDEPNLYALAAHVLVVTASTQGVAVIRNWLWLAFAGVAGATGWTALAAVSGSPDAALAGLALLAGSALLFTGTFGHGQHGQPLAINAAVAETPFDRPATLAFAILAIAFFIQAAANQVLPEPLTGFVVALIVAGAAIAWPALAAVALAAAAIALLAIASLDLPLAYYSGLDRAEDIANGLVPPDTAKYVRNAAFVGVPAAALVLWGAWRAAQTAPKTAGWLASAVGTIAFGGLVIAYLRVSPFETNRMFGIAALALAFVFAGLVESFTRRRPGDFMAPAPAAFAVTSIALLCLGLSVTLDSGWLPLALALASAGIGWIYAERPLRVLPWLALAAAIIAAAAIWFNTPFETETIGKTPFFNQLILLVGLPGLALAGGGELLRRRGSHLPAAAMVSLGFALLGLFVALQIRHWLNDGVLSGDEPGLAETATQALAALGFSLGLQRIAGITGARLYANLTAVAGGISALIIAFGLVFFGNPLINSTSIGANLIFNILLPGYLLPGLAAGAVAIQARPVRPRWYVLGFAALSGLLLFFWVTLTIRHAWKGDQMAIWHSASEAEVWSYSVAWLLLGGALLASGHFLRSQPVRIASGILIALTVCKVFLIDMSALTGAMRAFSFIGLGLSLLAIGRFYQQILLADRRGESAPDDYPPVSGP